MKCERSAQIQRMRDEEFDLLVIGGGATGAGIALDAASRGLRVALMEGRDFSSGTSSRSTKLIHGGVRYLERAVKQLDTGQFRLVWEALYERSILLKIAPHLTRKLRIVIPVYSWFASIYYWIGLKIYDLLAGKSRIDGCARVPVEKVREWFPGIKEKNLKGGVSLVDGQFNDARMNVSLILTAIQKGAVAANYLEAVKLLKEDSRICAVEAFDSISDMTITIRAKTFVNAAGPYSDGVRRLDEPEEDPVILGSSGVHLLLDKKYLPGDRGLLIPSTSDGRVIFLLPWEDSTLVGTTDQPTEISREPMPTKEEVEYLLKHIKESLGLEIAKSEIKAVWSGIRPLVKPKTGLKTAAISRDFKVFESESGLISIVGGKWTSYRKMAEVVVDKVIERGTGEGKSPCSTKAIFITGAEGYTEDWVEQLQVRSSLDEDVAQHLVRAYGSNAFEVVDVGLNERLSPKHYYVQGEVIYAVRNEMACTALDVLYRRTRLATVDQKAALEAFPMVIKLMSQELGWDQEKTQQETKETINFLNSLEFL